MLELVGDQGRCFQQSFAQYLDSHLALSDSALLFPYVNQGRVLVVMHIKYVGNARVDAYIETIFSYRYKYDKINKILQELL